MIFDQVKVITEKKTDSEILLALQTPNLFYVKIRNADEEIKNIEIYKATKKIEDFYLLPLIENILERQNIGSYDIEITFFDDMDSLALFELFIYVINRIYNINCEFEKSQDEIKLTLMGNVIYNTNMLYRGILK